MMKMRVLPLWGKATFRFPFSLILLLSTMGFSGQWTLNTSVQYSQGRYMLEDVTRQFALYTGLSYSSTRWSFSASIPVIGQNNNLLGQTGNILFPMANHYGESGRSGAMGHMGGRMSEPVSIHGPRWGFGDALILASFSLLSEQFKISAITLNSSIKLPTATDPEFSTGKVDWTVGVGVQKSLSTYVLSLEVGYMQTGDPDAVVYRNPWYVNGGVGKYWTKNFASLLYFQQYSRIVDGFAAPRQLSISFLYQFNAEQLLTLSSSIGLSNSVPDLVVAVGTGWQF